ncbi:MAG TPA: DUF4442 domain-containing protein [Thermoanaerobaculia bacterium]|nr:DUF4442 domain-containing protein [Thermoanaerobaculia bacterium]
MSTPTSDSKFLRRARSRLLMRLFFLGKLPLALFAGLRIEEITAERCAVSVPYGWRSTNPFRSTYFAALAMAAELSTGALAMAAVEASPVPVALLIVGLEAAFEKKAAARTTFTCLAGAEIAATVARAIATGEPQTVRAETIGRLPDGTVAARFAFTWSFKKRAAKA